MLDAALRVLSARHEGVPTLHDLLQVVQEGPEDLRRIALDRGSMDRYQAITEGLESALLGLCSAGGRLGGTFAGQTTTAMLRDRAVVFDVSGIDDGDSDLQAAVLMACWSAGFGAVSVSAALADAGLEPRRQYLCVMDELWRALRAGPGLVERVDALTRTNRTRGAGVLMITHTMADFEALPTAEDRAKARGFVERAGMVMLGGLPPGEVPHLRAAGVALSATEAALLASWTEPPAWDAQGREQAPPGLGRFLIKVGGKPGTPTQVVLTAAERDVSNTNRAWGMTR